MAINIYLFSVSWGTISGWWTLPCLALGFLYAYLLYQKTRTTGKNWWLLLFAFRAVAVFILSFLLLAPLVKSVKKHLQKPLILVLQDNSSSIKLFPAKNFQPTVFIGQLSQLKKKLGSDYDVREFHFDRNVSDGISGAFNGKQTDISNAFKILADHFENQNIGAVILVSDGLYNRGSSPLSIALNLKSNIYTIALGDTVPKRDILIDHINYNKTVFLGNDFLTDVYIEARQSKGKKLELNVSEDGKTILNQQIAVPENNFKKSLSIKLNASKKGLRKYRFSLSPFADEVSKANNSETIYVDVADNKKKILILYGAPHPDIAAIRESLESNQNYAVKAALLTDFDLAKLNDYSLLILQQLPDNRQNLQTLLTAANRSKLPLWYLIGGQTNISQLDVLQKVIGIDRANQNMQEVFASPDASFTSFILSDSSKTKIGTFPPLLAPFGSYSIGSASSVLLKQKIGSVVTSYPLLAFADENGRRTAVLAGEGLWKWRLNEFQQYGNHHAVDELLSQSVQYLTVGNNRKRFDVVTTKPVFDEDENVLIRAELYNPAFELTNQPDVPITIKDKTGKTYSYQFSRKDQSYQLDAGTLPPEDYNYEARTILGSEKFNAAGNFTIKALTAEAAETAANHQLLYALAKQNNGEMIFPDQIKNLPELIRRNENIKTVIYQDSSYEELINEKWIFILILVLLSTEWFLRRRNGET